jgi:hypothetical protein
MNVNNYMERILILSSHLGGLGLQSGLSLRLPHKNPVWKSPLPHICYMPLSIILLDFIIEITSGEKYRS